MGMLNSDDRPLYAILHSPDVIYVDRLHVSGMRTRMWRAQSYASGLHRSISDNASPTVLACSARGAVSW